jgi:hypothetical protein
VMPVPAATPEVVALLTSGLTASIGAWRCPVGGRLGEATAVCVHTCKG